MLLKCIQIFMARIIDVSLGTLRTVFFVKGKTIEPFIIAFFEVLIWYVVAKEALNTTGNAVLIAISYAGGYATGTFIGSKLSNLLVKGVVDIQTVIKNNSNKLVKALRDKGYGVSVIDLKNDYDGNSKDMLFIQAKSSRLKEVTSIIKNFDNEAFIIVNETKLVHNGFIK